MVMRGQMWRRKTHYHVIQPTFDMLIVKKPLDLLLDKTAAGPCTVLSDGVKRDIYQ